MKAKSKAKTNRVEWMKRGRVCEKEIATFRRIYDRTKRFCVCEIKSKLGMPTRYLTIDTADGYERILSRHRKLGAAKKAIEKLAPRVR